MSVKSALERISEARDKLCDLSALLSNPELRAPWELEMDVQEVSIIIGRARFELRKTRPRDLRYGIGIEHTPGEFGMIAGPVQDLETMLEHEILLSTDRKWYIRPDGLGEIESTKLRIIRFEGTREEPQETVICRMNNEGAWIHIRHE